MSQIPTPVTDQLLRVARRLHDIHERGRPEVSPTILLLAAAKTNAAVMGALRDHGFDLVRFEESLPRRKASARPSEVALDQRFLPSLKGVLDPFNTASTALLVIDGADHGRLVRAGLNVAAALEMMTGLGHRLRPEAVSMNKIRALPMTVSTKRLLDAAIERAVGLVTTSILVVAAIEDENAIKGSGPDILRNRVRAGDPERIDKEISTWMRFYETYSTRDASLPLFELFRYAAEIAGSVSAETIIHGRHLIGAIIASRDMQLGANELLAKVIAAEELARYFLNYIEEEGAKEPDPDDRAVWRRLLDVDDPSSVPRYDSEGYTKRDYLGIGTEVDAFAALIASKALQPPMSIGLFGDWGSGKSFFMSQLRDAVAELAGTSDSYYDRVVQIDFNAWHYVEANLWASLVENIFRNLRVTGEEPEGPRARTEAVLQRIDATLLKRAEQEKKVEQAQLARDLAAEKFEKKKAEVEKNAAKLSLTLGKDIWDAVTIDQKTRDAFAEALKKLGIDRAVTSTEDVKATIDEIRQLGGRTRLLWVWLTQKPLMWVLLGALILTAPFLAAAVTPWLKHYIPDISSSVSQLVSIVSAVVGWISVQLKQGGAAISEVEKAKEKIDEIIGRAETRKKRAIEDEQRALEDADFELRAAQKSLQTENDAVKTAEEELLNLRAGRQLARFIDDRATSDDYRKLLGVLATARNDFETLSALMRQQDDEQPLPAHMAQIERIDEQYRIDRIVLYIDDLDRCPPNRVVEVLQAVHLLLAFKLFVVVVGVDARWVTESLEYKFRNVWKQKRMPGFGAGARDYLEKIFQVPYWLKTLDTGATRRFVARLVDADVRRSGGGEEGERKTARAVGRGEQAVASRAASSAEPTERRERLASATQLQLSEQESTEMKKLSDLIGRSPRTVKRYINTYRIIRATIPPRRLEDFLKEDYRSVLLLLAIVVGVPRETFEIFKALETLAETLEVSEFAKMRPQGIVRSAFEAYTRERAITIGQLRQHIKTVSRYSFDRQEK